MSSSFRLFHHQPFSLQLQATDPENGTVHYSIADTPLTDMMVTPEGMLTIPNVTLDATFNVTVRVTDQFNGTSTHNMTLIVLVCDCQNGGTCLLQDDEVVCVCPAGLTGSHCNASINECLMSPCVNGTCKELLVGYKCLCDSGFTGQHCDGEINECLSSPCFSGVECTDLLDDFQCGSCPEGYTGDGINCTGEEQKPSFIPPMEGDWVQKG